MFWQSQQAEQTQTRRSESRNSDADGAVQQVAVHPTRRDGVQEPTGPHAAASGGLAQMFGLDIRAAILAVVVDLMVFGGDAISLGVLIPLGVVVAAMLGLIVYRIQTRWYGDEHDSALIKAMIIGLLTAIPAPLAPLIAIPGGLVGIVRAITRK